MARPKHERRSRLKGAGVSDGVRDWSDEMQRTIGLGVAGNFAGHLEQAGEASDFKDLKVADANAPKGVFPFYVPATGEHFLHCMPVSSEALLLGSVDEKHQIEPEVALMCDITYEGGHVVALTPRFAMAHNDCSIRREGARKISEKKNWGANTKGTSAQTIEIDHICAGGVLDGYRLASFLLRDGELHDYGVDSALASYSYYGDQLVTWLIDKMNTQQDEGPLEDIPRWLEVAGRPERALISIGATRYTEYGETTFLEPDDVIAVVLYDAARHDEAAVRGFADGSRDPDIDGLSLLRQRVCRG